MGMFLHILKYKIISFVKTTFDVRAVPIIRGVGSLLVFGGFASGAYILSHEITQYVLEVPRIGLFLFHRFISMMLFVFFVSVNLGNIIVSYATLYRSPEVAYLLTKPVSAVFIGADLLSSSGFVNKVGSLGITFAANSKNIPVYVLSILLKYDHRPFKETIIERREGKF